MVATLAIAVVFLLLSLLQQPTVLHCFTIPQTVGANKSHRILVSEKVVSLLLANKNDDDFGASMFGKFSGIASSLLKKPMNILPQVDTALSNLNVDSWETVRSSLAKLQTPEERQFRDNLALGTGVGSPLHKVRLFSDTNKEQDIQVIFYRDSASWCPYCQKVWMALEEKQIPYRIEKVNMRCYGDKPASFTRMQPSGQIPVAVINGRVYGQSNDILYALENDEAFANKKKYKTLQPPKGQEERAQRLLRLERQIFSTWMYWLTGSPDYRNDFVESLNQVEKELSQVGPFFLGSTVSLVDFMFAPFLERMAASMLYYKGFVMRTSKQGDQKMIYPALNRWFDAMEGLASYQLVKSDYYTHCWDLPPQLGGCIKEPAGEPYRRAINGESSILDSSRSSWELPLEQHLGGIEPDWTWAAEDELTAKREAVERVSANWDAIVRFAARGAGKPGLPPVSAPLADPNATPSEAVQGAVDHTLRVICMALLQGIEDSMTEMMKDVANLVVQSGDKAYVDGVIASLAYLRDRVGVPRDMKLPAARQLRAHLNWAISVIKAA